MTTVSYIQDQIKPQPYTHGKAGKHRHLVTIQYVQGQMLSQCTGCISSIIEPHSLSAVTMSVNIIHDAHIKQMYVVMHT